MSTRLKLIVAYDGASFSGWQSQANRNSIQDHLENAITRVCGAQVRVHGAGRTDAGVHALAQCAHVDVPARFHDAARWASALNGVLPQTIRVMRAGFTRASFHARFSAKGKRYRYRIWNGKVLAPFELGKVWHVRAPLDSRAMKSAAQLFLGRHDFASFAANRRKPIEDTVRTILKADVRRTGPLFTIEIEGNGFLYRMVRLIVGALVRVGSGDADSEEIQSRLQHPDRALRSARHAAPAAGLFLVRIRY